MKAWGSAVGTIARALNSMAEAEDINKKTDKSGEKTWQQRMSGLTRTAILDAAVDCFYDLGYANTSTENIAKTAGISRGAMLHHFPTRFDLIKAAVKHLNQKRLDWCTKEEAEVQGGAKHTRIEEGIDTYWKQLKTPEFVVFHELSVAARTDAELAKVLIPALQEFRQKHVAASRQLFPDLALSEAWECTNYLARFLLEGMAVAKMIEGLGVPEEQMLGWLKRELRRSYQDVLSTVKRSDAATALGQGSLTGD